MHIGFTAIAAFGLLASAASASTLITGASVHDGSGAPPRAVAVRIDKDRIIAVGALKPRRHETVIRADGLVLAPGFIDSHSHHDRSDYADRSMTPLLAQGVTTIVVGQDGDGDAPFAALHASFAARPAAINVAAYTGHGWLRDKVMGVDFKRTATPQEVQAMQALLAADLKAGSLGLSTGLEYDPGIYSSHDEVLALARTAKAGGGTYMSHIRSEDVGFDAAIDEILDIGAQTGIPVQISHLKIGIVDRWGEAKQVLAKLDAARARGINVTADVYPYEYWQSTLTVLFPKRDFTDLAASRFALTHLTTPAGMLIGYYAPEPAYVGKTIADIAALRGEEPAVTYLWLINKAQAWKAAHPEATRVESVIGTAMAPADIADFLAWPHSNLCSDGGIGGLHPRGYGAFGRLVRVYVRETGRLTLAEAIHKMSGLSAAHLGLKSRGLIRPGMAADLVLFDPDRFADTASVQSPNALAVGMKTVIVGGVPVWQDGKPTGTYPGHFLKRGQD
ncbi:N-acyl-D-amino-acid deacylase family protein [Sandarakinorhabdus oryzae]|uniref:N-acyl-D-amino-acid deacylase family protein n=1 Tax=Sandarakinorhabdus oryzae TaxID=2675220 RepID=UPI0012E13F27|nr:amidohydrolase family protein [Sandarakinorhabdus oryzae]